MITPYPQATNDKETIFFRENDIEVIQDESIIVDEAQKQFKNMNRVPSELLIERAVELGCPENVEAIVLSCCDMPTLDAIPEIEKRLEKPVTSSTQALFWRALRTAGVGDVFANRGRLLTEVQ